MMKSKNLFINISSILILIVSISILTSYRTIFPCNNEDRFVMLLLVLSFVALPVSLYKLLMWCKVNDSIWFWTGVITLALYIFSFNRGNKITVKEINQNGGVVKPAIIYKRYSSIQSAESVYIRYYANGDSIHSHYNCNKEVYNRLSAGDTILIVYSLQCPEWNLPFNYFPTKKEIQRCREGCLIKNGELLTYD